MSNTQELTEEETISKEYLENLSEQLDQMVAINLMGIKISFWRFLRKHYKSTYYIVKGQDPELRFLRGKKLIVIRYNIAQDLYEFDFFVGTKLKERRLEVFVEDLPELLRKATGL